MCYAHRHGVVYLPTLQQSFQRDSLFDRCRKELYSQCLKPCGEEKYFSLASQKERDMVSNLHLGQHGHLLSHPTIARSCHGESNPLIRFLVERREDCTGGGRPYLHLAAHAPFPAYLSSGRGGGSHSHSRRLIAREVMRKF